METTAQIPIQRLKIENTDIFLEEFDDAKGKITISDTYGRNYSYFWGSMGDPLKKFLCHINAGYFADKLMGAKSEWEIDVKNTFTEIRKFIRTEFNLPWYKHLDFQKDMREVLKEFESDCEERNTSEYFVEHFFSSFVNRLSFHLIKDRYDSDHLEKDFKDICECWNFIQQKHTSEYLWLVDFHGKLKKILQSK